LYNKICGGYLWLTPVILATQEAEITELRFKASLRKIEILSQKLPHSKKGWQSGSSGRVST
jgi:hypothetical protein